MAKKKPKLVWSHKKFGKGWEGFYERTSKSADRAYVLRKDKKRKSFESPAAAMKDGWLAV